MSEKKPMNPSEVGNLGWESKKVEVIVKQQPVQSGSSTPAPVAQSGAETTSEN